VVSRTTARWTLGLLIGLVAVGLLAASAFAQTPTATPSATPKATTTATAAATGTPAPAKTGNAGLVNTGAGGSAAVIALLAVTAGGVVLGGRALARRRS
jgi:hypothetical protein